MVLEFSFADFTRECSRSYPPVALQPGLRLGTLHRSCEELLELHHPERSSLLACKAGCGSCCIVNVSVLLPEAMAIVEYLEAQPEFDRVAMWKSLNQVWTRICGVDDEDRVAMRQTCVFLDKTGSCAVYPVRPLLCRGATSTDADSCRQALRGTLFSEKPEVIMNLFQRELFAAAYVGLSEGLEERGIDGRGFELTGILRYLLGNPQRRCELQSGLRLNWDELI